jgi:hypothetical protein
MPGTMGTSWGFWPWPSRYAEGSGAGHKVFELAGSRHVTRHEVPVTPACQPARALTVRASRPALSYPESMRITVHSPRAGGGLLAVVQR